MSYAQSGYFAGGMGRNRSYLEGLAHEGKLALRIASRLSTDHVGLLCDSETSGGLLFSAPEERAQEVRDRFRTKGEPVWDIGEVIAEQAIEVV
jgi:selenophosphate synthase